MGGGAWARRNRFAIGRLPRFLKISLCRRARFAGTPAKRVARTFSIVVFQQGCVCYARRQPRRSVMKRIFPGSILFGSVAVGILTAGITVAAAAQSAPQDTLPPVQAPPEMDSPAAKAAPPAAKAPAPTAQAAGSNAPLVPLANSDAEAQA